jgi:hypothetical protein
VSRFVRGETDAIDLGDGDVVHIRRKMSYGQQRALSSLMAPGRDPIAATSEYLVAVLEQNIVRWEGPGFQNGTGLMPLNRESIDALNPEIGARLINEIAVRNGVKPDSFPASATSSSPASSGMEAKSPSSMPNSESANGSGGPGKNS